MSDTMLLGVLRMPFELAMSMPTARFQYHQRGVQAADEIEKLRAEVERLRAQIVSLEATGAEASDEIDRLRDALEAKP